MTQRNVRDFWPPWAAGVGLGLTLAAMFMLTGHGLGANGFFTRLDVAIANQIAPVWAQAQTYFKPYLATGQPLAAWISWEVIGVAIGALLGSLSSRRFRLTVERGAGIAVAPRLLLALAGGVLTGFGAPLARGCTSGLGLSGGATLAVGAFVFLIAFFIAGLVMSHYTRRIWQ